ncbi:MAG TPA: DUF1273 domain-containing protein [Clostridiales bacterium]|nr:DUF1273 domain-containing protein [Clostridiales bacterium]
MIEKTVCFSGHRPMKLPGKGDWSDRRTKIIKSMLYYRIHTSIEEGYTHFITGLARGIDLWAAMFVLELKSQHPELSLICVKPTEDHGNKFTGEDKYMLEYALFHADKIVCTSPSYHANCYRIRNQYMVDNSSQLIAVVNDYASGTGQTIKYAQKKGKKADVINTAEINEVYKSYYNTI